MRTALLEKIAKNFLHVETLQTYNQSKEPDITFAEKVKTHHN